MKDGEIVIDAATHNVSIEIPALVEMPPVLLARPRK